MNEKRQREWEQLERSLEEMDKIAQECMAKGLCGWCCERPAVTTEGECKECSRLPGHTHAGEDERDDTITRLQHELREAQAGAAVLRIAVSKLLNNHAEMVNHNFPGGLKPQPLPNEMETMDLRLEVIEVLNVTTAGAELLRELDDLRQSDILYAAMKQGVTERIGDLEDTIADLRTRNERLAAALEPFVNHEGVVKLDGDTTLTKGDFEAARVALKGINDGNT